MRAPRGSTGPLDAEEKAIVKKYAGFLKDVPGPVSVWVTTDGGILHFHTLVSKDEDSMSAVFRAERELLLAIDPLIVDFDVYDRPESLRYVTGGEPPLVKRN